jgi:hypothetical protein
VNFRHVPERVSHYLSTGGLWNPEMADHDEVRNMLIDARDVIEMLIREREHTGYEILRLQLTNEMEMQSEQVRTRRPSASAVEEYPC